jgi:hypothetical protein
MKTCMEVKFMPKEADGMHFSKKRHLHLSDVTSKANESHYFRGLVTYPFYKAWKKILSILYCFYPSILLFSKFLI